MSTLTCAQISFTRQQVQTPTSQLVAGRAKRVSMVNLHNLHQGLMEPQLKLLEQIRQGLTHLNSSYKVLRAG